MLAVIEGIRKNNFKNKIIYLVLLTVIMTAVYKTLSSNDDIVLSMSKWCNPDNKQCKDYDLMDWLNMSLSITCFIGPAPQVVAGGYITKYIYAFINLFRSFNNSDTSNRKKKKLDK